MIPGPYCVALTGGIGSGKSTVAAVFARLGADVVDTDAIARELTASAGAAIPAILDVFGTEYVTGDGCLDRRRMRETVFADPGARLRLEGILHPMIRELAAQSVAASNAPYVILVVPLLVESGAYWNLVDRVLVIDCAPLQQLERVVKRDGVPEPMVRMMLAAQASREARLSRADDVIDNRGDAGAIESTVCKLHQDYLSRAGEKKACLASQPLH